MASLPARDLMDENFDNELLKATLSWDGLVGAKLAPRSPNSAVLTMLYRMAGQSGSVQGLVKALSAAAVAAGAEIRNNATVDRILIDGSTDGLVANGVQLSRWRENRGRSHRLGYRSETYISQYGRRRAPRHRFYQSYSSSALRRLCREATSSAKRVCPSLKDCNSPTDG